MRGHATARTCGTRRRVSARAIPTCWPRRASPSKSTTAPTPRSSSAKPSTSWSASGIRCPGSGTAPRPSPNSPNATTPNTVGRCRSATPRCSCSRATTTVRCASCGATCARAPRRRWPTRAPFRRVPRSAAAGCGGPNTAVRNCSSSGSARSSAAWICRTACPARSRGCAARSIPRRRTMPWDGWSMRPTAVIRWSCGPTRAPNGAMRPPSGSSSTAWRGTTARLRGTCS